MERDIKIKWFYPYPPEIIWKYLTEIDLLKKWTGFNDFKPEVGFEFHATSKPIRAQKFDGMMYHKVLEVVPLKKLSYTFQGGPGNGVITLDTVVTWTLIPKDNGTELHLVQSGFKGTKNYLASFFMELGWKKHIAKRFKRTLEEAKV